MTMFPFPFPGKAWSPLNEYFMSSGGEANVAINKH